MANNKFYGYTPKKDEITTGWENGPKTSGNRLDKINPYEFRKGMDYELTAMGISRLQESTVEEREKATETVIKNLENKCGYYTSLITYETLFRNVQGVKPSFTAWLKEQDEIKMQEVKSGDKDSKHKNDKMTEPKYDKKEYTVPFKTDKLKESIKNKIKKILLEKKVKEQNDMGFDDDDVAADKAAAKGAKKRKKSNRFDLEREAIKDLLYRGKKGKDSEYTEDEPAPKSILDVKNQMLDLYKNKYKGEEGGVENYNADLKKANEKFKKLLEKHVEKFGEGEKGLGNKVDMKIVYGEKLPDTIKLLGARLKDLEKEEQEDLIATNELRREVAMTDMTRAQHIKLLEIIKSKGVSLREGTDMIRPYYEIAKSAYLEGLANGLKI
tara:strand:- start:132 stop:1280 length:1149 start_codon:yes stop_codon:yes gene_type:complete